MSNAIQKPKVILFDIEDNAKKLQYLCDTVRHFFSQKEPLVLMVPSDEAAQYVDQLLWRLPKDSFIPHAIANEQTTLAVAITTTNENVNQAKVLMNLCQDCRPIFTSFAIIYDFLDKTHPDKKQKSETRLAYYREHHFEVLLS